MNSNLINSHIIYPINNNNNNMIHYPNNNNNSIINYQNNQNINNPYQNNSSHAFGIDFSSQMSDRLNINNQYSIMRKYRCNNILADFSF